MQFPFWPNPSGYRDIDLGLSRIYELLKRVGNPHSKLPSTIHIAGTNGKGSTLAFLRAIFENADYKVHCYTSPHLVEFNERIVLAGKEVSDDFLNEILSECKKAAEIEPKINVTFFEGITVAAFLAFSKVKADVLLLEVGMGGRLDATNVIEKPDATIITPISFDHTEFLGKTLGKISFEKCGIIKPNCPVIVSKQKPSALKTIKEVARKNNSKIILACPSSKNDNSEQEFKLSFDSKFRENNKKNLIFPTPSLTGKHQLINAATAIATILSLKNQFRISQENIIAGIKNAKWKARLQKIIDGKFSKILPENFELFLDGSHNPQGAKTIIDWLKTEKKINSKNKNYLICAMLLDKDSAGFLKNFKNEIETLIGLEIPNESKSKSAKEICKIAKSLDIKAIEGSDFEDAIKKIISYHQKNYSKLPAKIIICGSLYLAGEFLKINK